MRKRGQIFLSLGILAVLMTGCGMPNLTEDQEDVIAQYAADKAITRYKQEFGMLDVDTNVGAPVSSDSGNNASTDNGSLQRLEETTEAPSEAPTEKTEGNETQQATEGTTESSESTGTKTDKPATDGKQAASLEEALGIEGVTVKAVGYSVVDSYPKGGILTVDADKGYKLLAVEYAVTNPSDKEVTMAVDTAGVSIKAIINGDQQINIYKTMLKSDLMNMNGIIFQPGETKSAAFIFKIKEDIAKDIQGVSVQTIKR